MNALVYISMLSIAVCHVAALRHEKQQTAGDQDASALCCYPPKYAWRKYYSYVGTQRSVNTDGEIETKEFIGKYDAIFEVFDGERLYEQYIIFDTGVIYLITPTSQYGGETEQYLHLASEGDCFEIQNMTFRKRLDVKCFEGEYAGIQEMNGNRYNMYRYYNQTGGSDPTLRNYRSIIDNKLYATRDVNGDCIPQLEILTLMNSIFVDVTNVTYVQADFGSEEERLVEMPPASKMCPPSEERRRKKADAALRKRFALW